MAFCHNCGTHLADGAAFCANCGAAQKPAAPQQNTNQNTQQNTYQQQTYQQNNYQQQTYWQNNYQQQTYQQAPPQQENSFKKLMDTPDHTDKMDPNDIQQNNIMAIFCYLGILVLIPIFAVKNSRYCRFHANQGLVSIIVSSLIGAISSLLGAAVHWVFFLLFSPAIVAILALQVLGIIYAIQGKARELPIIGKISLLKW